MWQLGLMFTGDTYALNVGNCCCFWLDFVFIQHYKVTLLPTFSRITNRPCILSVLVLKRKERLWRPYVPAPPFVICPVARSLEDPAMVTNYVVNKINKNVKYVFLYNGLVALELSQLCYVRETRYEARSWMAFIQEGRLRGNLWWIDFGNWICWYRV